MIYEHKETGEKYYVSPITEVSRNGHKFQYVMTHISGDGIDHYKNATTIESDYICIEDRPFMDKDDPRINERIQCVSTLGRRNPPWRLLRNTPSQSKT